MGNRADATKLLVQGEQSARDTSKPTTQDHAYQLLASACYCDPSWAHAFYVNGCTASDLVRPHAAVALFRRALEGEQTPNERHKTLTNLAWELMKVGKQAEAMPLLQQAIDLEPKSSLPWMHLGMCHQTFGETQTAVSCARKCFELADPNYGQGYPIAEFQLAFAMLFNRQYAEGLKHFESRFAARLPNFLLYPYKKWKGEHGKTLFLVADQGLGDTLSFSRFVREAASRCSYIHMCVQSELRRVFEYAFRDISNINFMPSPSNFPGDADAWSTFVSLPYALGLSNVQIVDTPNIDMPRFPMSNQWKVPDRKFHIGIAWAGSPLNDIDKHRNIPIHHFVELYRVPGIQLYSLQVDAKKTDLNLWGFAPLIRDLSGYIRDVADTVSTLEQLDLVITVESALGHIASMSDKECWIPYSHLGRDYRIGVNESAERLWTPKHRIFQQSDDMRWEPVFDRIVEALKEKVDGMDETGVFQHDFRSRVG
jgi:tetratricopeptide (TPR) repeat protein